MKRLDFSGIDKVYLITGFTDMRKGIDGLAHIVAANHKLDPFSSSLFLFCGRKTSSIKGLIWEGDGFVLITKRLKDGKYQWPRNSSEALNLTDQQIRWLLEGLNIEQKKALKNQTPKRVL